MRFEMKSYGYKIYLRDLKDELQRTEIAEIEKIRPDLLRYIEEGSDILIGYSMQTHDYEVA